MEDKAWHIAPSIKQQAVSHQPQSKYTLIPADGSDVTKVVQFYTHHPVSGYGIGRVEVIVNPEFNRAFSLELSRLQEKGNNAAFLPKWDQMTGADQRRDVMATWTTLTQPYTDPAYPAVRLLPAWHGTRSDLLDSIFRVGYSNLSFTDDGFFGKGLYSAYEAEYAYRVYSKGALVVNWVASFSMLPVIDGDMELLRGRGNYGNYDGHFVPVAPRNPDNPDETVYYPCRLGQTARYHEVVVFQTAACLPRYLVTLESVLLKNPSTPSLPLVETLSADYGANALPGVPVITQTTDASTDQPSTSSADYGNAALPVWQPSEEQRDRVLSEGKVALKTGRYAEARQRLEPLTEVQQPDPTADILLGWLYANAIYPADEQKAQAYYAKAYTQKGVLAQQAHQTGDKEAQYLLGLLLVHATQATPQERQQGVDQLTLAAKQGHAGAQRELGILYQSGKGIAANDQTPGYCYQSAAQQGDTRAMYHLATCYAQGRGIPKDQAQALEGYRQAASQGDALAQNNLGLCYEQGDGVKQDYVQAAQYYQQSAAQGYGLAQHNLAVIYENGRAGVPKDLVKAAQYYHLAVAQGLARAQNNLARFYEQGLGGMPQDMNEAFRLYQAAAQQGYARAQYNVGVCYETGRGTTQDIHQAKHYYTLAANANERISPDAKKRLEQLAQRMPATPAPTTTPFWNPPRNATPPRQTTFQLPPQNRPF